MKFNEYFSTHNVTLVFNSKLKNSDVVGVDGMNAKKFEKNLENQVEIIVRKCLNGTYKFTRFKEKLVPKDAQSQPRQISIPTIRDALVLRILFDLLERKFPNQKLIRPHFYIANIRSILDTHKAGDKFLRLDVKDFYPSINRKILKKELKLGGVPDIAIDLIMKAIKKVNRGVPQGLSISNILASIYFSKTDEYLKRKSKGRYFRYVDDILFICNATEHKKLRKKTENLLKSKLKLSVHKPGTSISSKSTTQSTCDGIDYLGFHITDKHLEVRKGSYKKVFEAVINLITSYAENYENYPTGWPRNCFRERFLWRLNLRITGCILHQKSIGWMFFFRQTENIKQIKQLDAFVAKALEKRGLSDLQGKVKKFTRTYYEIRYNRSQTSYVPNFDELDKEGKIAEMIKISGKKKEEFDSLEGYQVDERFRYIIRREVRWMKRATLYFSYGY